MTWLDIAFIVVLVIFLAVGSKLGSMWTGACLIGGFFGGFLADYYALPMSSMIGDFAGAVKLSAALLFLAGVLIALVPGWVLSKLSSGLILGVVDSVFGLVTGALAGVIAASLVFLFIMPHAPGIEKSSAWRRSTIVKPFHHFIEDVFNDSHFQRQSAMSDMKDEFVKDFTPVVQKAEKSLKSAGGELVDKIKKK